VDATLIFRFSRFAFAEADTACDHKPQPTAVFEKIEPDIQRNKMLSCHYQRPFGKMVGNLTLTCAAELELM